MTPFTNLTQERARELFDYDPEAGMLTWRSRRLSDFPDLRSAAVWNSRYAGNVAGTLSKDGAIRITLTIGVRRYVVLAHRIIWLWATGRWPQHGVDHRNLVRSDNRFLNLREATQSQNGANVTARKRNSSGFKGVTPRRETGKFVAQIRARKRHYYLGIFSTAEAAHAAYVNAAQNLFGEFARAV